MTWIHTHAVPLFQAISSALALFAAYFWLTSAEKPLLLDMPPIEAATDRELLERHHMAIDFLNRATRVQSEANWYASGLAIFAGIMGLAALMAQLSN